jgi:transposase
MKKTKLMLEIEARFGEDLGDLLRRNYLTERMNPSKIGEELGASGCSIEKWLKKYEIKTRNISEAKLPAGVVKPGKEELERMYNQMSTVEIAEKLGTSNTTVGKWLKKYGIKIRNNSESQLPAGFVKPAKEELETLYLKQMKSIDEIAEKFGMSGITISGWLKRYEIKTRNISEAKLPAGVVKPGKEELERMYNQMSTVEIAEKLGTSNTTVGKWLKKYGIKIRNNSESQLPAGFVKPAKEELETLYLKQMKSIDKIAKYYKVNVRTIGRWFEEYKINLSNKNGIYHNKELRKKCIDELLEFIGKRPEELSTTDFRIKKKDGISCKGVLSWYERNYNCNSAAARDILIQDIYSTKKVSEKEELEGILRGYVNEKN